MSEDEILEIIKDHIDNGMTDKTVKLDTIIYLDEAIKGLYDMYKTEKEKNIKLDREIKKRQWIKVKENGEIEPLFYISKDKIREKIDEIEERAL